MKKKIFTTYMLLLLIGIILSGLLSLSFIRIRYISKVEEMLLTNGNLINSIIEDKLNGKDLEEIDFSRLAHDFSHEVNARITFIDKKGVVIGDSEIDREDLFKIENHLNRPEVQEAIRGGIGKSKRYSTTIKTEYLYVAVSMVKGNEIYGITRLAYPLTEISKINLGLIENILISIIIGLMAAVLLGYRFVNRVTEPIKEITGIAQRIANGDLNNRVHVESSDEIKILADTFNLMSDKLSKYISELQDKNTKLKSILASMKEGLIAVDNQQKIILVNSPAKSLFNIGEDAVLGKHILDVIGNEEIKDTLNEILDGNNIADEREITIEYPEIKILKIYYDSIKLNEDPNRIIGSIMLILDITEMRKLEKIRTEFVANVSHELKTPLTSIMGFVETLKNGAINNEEVRDRFLDIIEIETERLTRLIDDLLTLSDIESNRLTFSKKEHFSVNEVMVEVGHMMSEKAKQKELTYTGELEESLPKLYGNRDWFKQMILNLVDNAIKYTPEGGKVKVLAYKREKNIFIVVKDTGIGVPKRDIPRLFERFYRVDKARSRKVGGTGLGLAIVKHIVIAFNGEIKVKSEEGKGSEFIVRIPY